MAQKLDPTLKAPFPYFGGKSRIASIIWRAFGDPQNYVEPFYGSGAVHLARPIFQGRSPMPAEIVNDMDCMITNFWRAVKYAGDVVAKVCDYPMIETDFKLRARWLSTQYDGLKERIEADEEYFDAKIAGWWVYVRSSQLGADDTALNVTTLKGTNGVGMIHDQKTAGGVQGFATQTATEGAQNKINYRKIINTANAETHRTAGKAQGTASMVMTENAVCGVQADRMIGGGMRHEPQIAAQGNPVYKQAFADPFTCQNENPDIYPDGLYQHAPALRTYFALLHNRLRRVKIMNGDFARTLTPATLGLSNDLKSVAVFLDPPYPQTSSKRVYKHDSCAKDDPATRAHTWAINNAEDPRLKIAFCCYEGQFEFPASWTKYEWKTMGGLGNTRKSGKNENAAKERIWFSPACINLNNDKLF